MKKLIKTQYSLKKSLDQAYSNFKRTGDARRKPAYLSERIKQISNLWTEFQRNHLAIDIVDDEELKTNEELINTYTTNNIYELFEATYFEFLGELEDILERKCSENSDDKNTTIQRRPEGRFELKLPRIDLPKFNGDYRSWRSFHDMFISLIHTDSKIPDVQKLHYLKSCLNGEPERIIKQFDMVDSNYDAAWQTLVDRYNNKRILITSQMKELFNQSNIKNESKKAIKDLIDKTKECIHELNAMDISTKDWDPIIIYLLVQKLPHETHKLWEQDVSKQRELPTLSKLYDFLESRFRTLEAMADSSTQNIPNTPRKTNNYHINQKTNCVVCKGNHTIKNCRKFANFNPNVKRDILRQNKICFSCLQRHDLGSCQLAKHCVLCKKTHTLRECDTYKQLSITDKQKLIAKNNLCYNCLTKHTNIACPSHHGCFKCGKRHHTSLHEEKPESTTEEDITKVTSSPLKQETTTECHYNRNQTQSLLATAIVTVESNNSNSVSLRALIDLGSQSSFITEATFQTLRMKGEPTFLQIAGLGSTKLTTSRKEASFMLHSNTTQFKMPMKAYVIKNITNIVPPTHISSTQLKHIENLHLADPEFTKPGKIDLLLGVNIYSKIISNGVIHGENGAPTAQNTKLGWILFGEIPSYDNPERSFSALVNENPTIETLNTQMQKFWSCEELPNKRLSKEEEECEEFYQKTVTRLTTGQYQVRLPFKDNLPPELGDSKRQALSRYIQLERKFKQNQELYNEYANCLNDYIEQGHMIPTTSQEVSPQNNYFMPHHAVIKESTTTKVRVVFDASAKSSNGHSLNEQMMNGPTIQPKLFATLLSWRRHRFAMTADIQKMYRMIKMHPDDQKYQKILWRETEASPIKEYKLTTVTFGTTAAPFLAIRTLHQLATDEKDNFPKASEVVLRDFYVDDVLTGGDNIQQAIEIQKELLSLLKSGGFHLRKWAANDDSLLNHVPEEDREVQLPLRFYEDSQIKALGIYWHPALDYFSFAIDPTEFNKPPISKRNILSEIAKLYDPLGWLAPSVIIAKILMQKLWLCNCSWDEPIPSELGEEWKKFKEELSYVNHLKIPRWIHTQSSQLSCQLHAFCDSSTKAFAAVVYIRIVNKSSDVHVNLLTAKTKVAPIKPMSLPRLELCGAVLLSRLIKQIKIDMDLNNTHCYCWCDSKIVLSWINKPANNWQTFVANRVGEIQDNNANCSWRYVQSKENPADIATRGISPRNMLSCDKWWNGPDWLKSKAEDWQRETREIIETTLEKRTNKNIVLNISHEDDTITKYSSFEKLLRIIAYCFRFKENCKNKENRVTGNLGTTELTSARNIILRCLQHRVFAKEIKQLELKQQISKSSSLFKLSPIIDKNGILRLGGRLSNSSLPFNKKHQIILPNKEHVTNLIIEYFHKVSLHGGPQLVLTTMKLHGYWIINGMHTIKGKLSKCTKCIRFRKIQQTQMMGELPEVRVTQARPFQNVGLDYAGPINLKMSKHRGAREYKGYICIFVCMAIKAAHLEVVSDLTSDAFLAAFRRFISRRGLCSDVYSDNGTTFVGANKQLREEIKRATNFTAEKTAIQGIKWHFNPPYAPHMGGLWEASVKKVKHHLKRMLQQHTLTFEELTTLLAQIEACINSRPLNTVSGDATSLEPLTPGHFLIGTALLSPPETELYNKSYSISNRWKYIQQLRQNFWKRWSSEYLLELQNRQKWHSSKPNIKTGQIVIIKDDKLPPLKWSLGRVEKLHSGNDGKVRVVTLKTESAVIQRPIVKLCPLFD